MKVIERLLSGLLAFNVGLIGGIFIFTSVGNVAVSAAENKAVKFRDDTLAESTPDNPEVKAVSATTRIKTTTSVKNNTVASSAATVTPVTPDYATLSRGKILVIRNGKTLISENISFVSSTATVKNNVVSILSRENGATFAFGHVYQVFSKLNQLIPGDEIYLGGSKYLVQSNTTVPYDEAMANMGTYASYKSADKNKLYLMTCAGNYGYVPAAGKNTYSHRTIVFATLAN